MKNIFLLCFTLPLLVSSCGKKTTGEARSKSTLEAVENSDGTYLAVFQTINAHITGKILGSLTLVKEGDRFLADIRLTNSKPNSVHRQNIHIGTHCPGMELDVNQDGFVDIVEARPALDSVLIPLDGDLNTQQGNADYWPVSDQYGSYFWGKLASYSSMIQDLVIADENADDNITKLDKNQALSLIGKIILIQGVPETQLLPDTVATMGRFSKMQTLPVACGVISKVTKGPGIIDYSDEVPGQTVPGGESVGGSSGAEDGSIFRNTETTSSGKVP